MNVTIRLPFVATLAPAVLAILVWQPAVAAAQAILCPAVKDNSIQAHPAEVTFNSGALGSVRIKDDQHYALLAFDCSAAFGVPIQNATLYVFGSSPANFDIARVSTVAADWGEGAGTGGAPSNGGSCFSFAFYPAGTWAGAGSDFSSVALGAGGSLVNTGGPWTVVAGEWSAIPLDPALAQALIDGTQYGLVLGIAPGDYANDEIGARDAGSGAFIVINDDQVPVGAIQVTVDQADRSAGDTVTGRVDIVSAPAGLIDLTMRRVDSYGRVLAETTASAVMPGAAPVPFSFEVRRPIALEERIEAEAIVAAGGALVGRDSASYGITQAADPWDDWHAIMWGGDDVADARFWQGLRDTGVRYGVVYHAGSNRNPLRHAFRWSDFTMLDKGVIELVDGYYDPLFNQFQASGRTDKTVFRRDPDLVSDANFTLWQTTMLQPKVDRDRPYKPIVYDLGDEIGMGRRVNPWDFDLSDAAVADFRAWLSRRYGDIGALNARWGASFPSFAAIDPIAADTGVTTEEIRLRELGAQQRAFDWDENFSPWFDFKEYTDDAFASALTRLCAWLAALEPDIPCGFAGGQQPAAHSGYDYFKLMQSVRFVEPYDIGSSVEIARSFLRGRGPLIRTQFAADRPGVYQLWHYLLRGERGIYIWWYQDWFEDFVSFRLSPYAMSLAPTLRELDSGIGRLVAGSTLRTDPVAILYSQPSLRVQWMWDSTPDGGTWPRRFGSYDSERNMIYLSWAGWRMALEDAGIQPEFISTQELAAGALAARGHRVLILPRAVALSDAEAAAIGDFVRAGGFVIADSETGLFDAGGAARPGTAGALDGLFGIARASRGVSEQDGTTQPAWPGPLAPTGASPLGCYPLDNVDLSSASLYVVEDGVRAASGQALAAASGDPQHPAILVRRDGAGAAIYLNLSLVPYPTDRMTPGSEKPMRTLLANLLACAGVAPSVRVTATTGDPFPSLLKAWFDDGTGNAYVGLGLNTPFGTSQPWDWSERDDAPRVLAGVPGPAVPIDVRLTEPRAVYDVRSGAYLGWTDHFATTFDIYEAGLYALLRAPVRGLDLSARIDADCAIQWRVEVLLPPGDEALAGRHVLRLEVFAPDGTPLDHYGGTFSCPDGIGSGVVPLAVSDPPGAYRIVVTDIASGARAETTVSCASPDTTPPGPSTGLAANGCAVAVLTWVNPPDADLAGVLWLRSEGVAPDTPPSTGAGYAVGSAMGNARVVFKSTPGEVSWTDAAAPPAGVTWFYAGYAFDTAANYGPAASAAFSSSGALFDPRDVKLTKSGLDVAFVWSGPGPADCPPSAYGVHRAADPRAFPLPVPLWTVPGGDTATTDAAALSDASSWYYQLLPQP